MTATELWEAIEWLVYLATALGAVFAGVWAVRQGSDDRKELAELRAEITDVKLDCTLLRHDYESTATTVMDHEDRIRGIEKRRRVTK